MMIRKFRYDSSSLGAYDKTAVIVLGHEAQHPLTQGISIFF